MLGPGQVLEDSSVEITEQGQVQIPGETAAFKFRDRDEAGKAPEGLGLRLGEFGDLGVGWRGSQEQGPRDRSGSPRVTRAGFRKGRLETSFWNSPLGDNVPGT